MGKRRMESGWWITPACAFALAAFMIVLGVWDRQINRYEASTMTSTVTASVLAGASESTHRECGSEQKTCSTTYTCTIRYVFTPDPARPEARATGEAEESGRCGEQQAEGTQRTVYFDPADTAQSTVSDPNAGLNRHGWLLWVGIGVLSLAFGFAGIWFHRWLAGLGEAKNESRKQSAGPARPEGAG
ncbi:DUF3592 domain-containing protein [Brevibacterium sp. 50QC2O2]|uniref:DUF3592 domain-containing protein n=1 Tax=Brevibacterium TaxID=1696 RepID=UPI00211BC002|nr:MULTISPECIES: DUF3592 domain-containing protein [unclassified Brevibacterium]MCQ9385642.1 DUF3592 domain-containing protein [Brevibacterium sp. 68QC2CO]MCQ9389545.1 DUF3592 domain-containing protein [Brevibacterium sp. 50QC2O2]